MLKESPFIPERPNTLLRKFRLWATERFPVTKQVDFGWQYMICGRSGHPAGYKFCNTSKHMVGEQEFRGRSATFVTNMLPLFCPFIPLNPVSRMEVAVTDGVEPWVDEECPWRPSTMVWCHSTGTRGNVSFHQYVHVLDFHLRLPTVLRW